MREANKRGFESSVSLHNCKHDGRLIIIIPPKTFIMPGDLHTDRQKGRQTALPTVHVVVVTAKTAKGVLLQARASGIVTTMWGGNLLYTVKNNELSNFMKIYTSMSRTFHTAPT